MFTKQLAADSLETQMAVCETGMRRFSISESNYSRQEKKVLHAERIWGCEFFGCPSLPFFAVIAASDRQAGGVFNQAEVDIEQSHARVDVIHATAGRGIVARCSTSTTTAPITDPPAADRQR
jgi:hypothetical protein